MVAWLKFMYGNEGYTCRSDQEVNVWRSVNTIHISNDQAPMARFIIQNDVEAEKIVDLLHVALGQIKNQPHNEQNIHYGNCTIKTWQDAPPAISQPEGVIEVGGPYKITWLDSTRQGPDWECAHEVKERMAPVEVQSYGITINVQKTFITLAPHYGETDASEFTQCHGAICIPVCCIKKAEKLP